MDYNINSISPSSIFTYAIIFCISIIYFRNTNITLGVFLGIIFAIICSYALFYREITTNSNKEQLHKIKSENIVPVPENLTKYTDLTDFVFSIQDFYIYNPQSYENMVHALDTFVNVYEDVLIDNSLAGDFYSIADAQKLLALNALHSVIMMIPSSKKLIHKLDDSMKILESILNKYLVTIYEKNKLYIQENGFFNNSKVIELNVAPYNKYKNETFDQYY